LEYENPTPAGDSRNRTFAAEEEKKKIKKNLHTFHKKKNIKKMSLIK
jgi:hypothetical protein